MECRTPEQERDDWDFKPKQNNTNKIKINDTSDIGCRPRHNGWILSTTGHVIRGLSQKVVDFLNSKKS